MNVQFRDRPQAASTLGLKTAIADCDIHPARATSDELYPFLAKRWHGHLETFGMHAYKGMLAGPAYRLLGKKDLGTPGNWRTDPMPAVNQLIGGELAWRQHSGGHTDQPQWPTFFQWVSQYITSPAAPRK